MKDKSNSAKKPACVQECGAAKRRLRQMKETWWSATAELLQLAADRYDMKAFYHGLKAGVVLGTRAVVQFARKMARHLSQIVQAFFLAGQNTFTVS